MTATLQKIIESILFYKAEPMAVEVLARMTGRSTKDVEQALSGLGNALAERGVRLLRKDDGVMLATAPEAGPLLERIAKEERSKDIGKAGLETLAIILYRGPVTRAEVDYIRGVNSTFILRHLTVRGLVERIPNPEDSRSFLYRPTFELLSFLGITSIEELPEYASIMSQLDEFYHARQDVSSNDAPEGPAAERKPHDHEGAN